MKRHECRAPAQELKARRNIGEVWAGKANTSWTKAVEDCRSPRRFANVGPQETPPSLGLRQPSGALTVGEEARGAEFRLRVHAHSQIALDHPEK